MRSGTSRNPCATLVGGGKSPRSTPHVEILPGSTLFLFFLTLEYYVFVPSSMRGGSIETYQTCPRDEMNSPHGYIKLS